MTFEELALGFPISKTFIEGATRGVPLTDGRWSHQDTDLDLLKEFLIVKVRHESPSQ